MGAPRPLFLLLGNPLGISLALLAHRKGTKEAIEVATSEFKFLIVTKDEQPTMFVHHPLSSYNTLHV